MSEGSRAWQFKPGNSGGPGRPKGARSKLQETFLSALHKSFEERGEEAIKTMLETDPSGYCKMVASLLPRRLEGSDDEDAVPVAVVFQWAKPEPPRAE